MGMVGLGAGGVSVATGSPANQLSSDRIGKSNDAGNSKLGVAFGHPLLAPWGWLLGEQVFFFFFFLNLKKIKNLIM
jgi:hypothetical protein